MQNFIKLSATVIYSVDRSIDNAENNNAVASAGSINIQNIKTHNAECNHSKMTVGQGIEQRITEATNATRSVQCR